MTDKTGPVYSFEELRKRYEHLTDEQLIQRLVRDKTDIEGRVELSRRYLKEYEM